MDTYGSRSLAVGGQAIKAAGERLVEKARIIAAHQLEVAGMLTGSDGSATPSRSEAARRPMVAAGKAPMPYAEYAPSMYSEPFAKVTERLGGKGSGRPAATRNSAEAGEKPRAVLELFTSRAAPRARRPMPC